MSISQDQIRKQLFNVFNPIEALPPNDPRYVECNEVRGSVGLLNTLANSIRFSDGVCSGSSAATRKTGPRVFGVS